MPVRRRSVIGEWRERSPAACGRSKPQPLLPRPTSGAARDEAAAQNLRRILRRPLQVLFATVLYSPAFVTLLAVVGSVEFGSLFATASPWAFIIDGLFLYLLALVTPFASLLWVMVIKLFMGGDIYKTNVIPGVYPKWSKMHLRIWCIGKLERMVLLPLGMLYRSAPLMAFALRQLGATVEPSAQLCCPVRPLTCSSSRTMSPSRAGPDRRRGRGSICTSALFASRADARSECAPPSPTM